MRAWKRLERDLERGCAHLELPHLLGYRSCKLRRCLRTYGRELPCSFCKLGLGSIERLLRLAYALSPILRCRDSLFCLRPPCHHMGKVRAIGTDEPLVGSLTLLQMLELFGIELDRVGIVPELRCSILSLDEGTLEGISQLSELLVEARCLPQLGDCRGKHIGDAIVSCNRLMCAFGSTHERLGMLCLRQRLFELCIVFLGRSDLVDAREHECRLVELLLGGTARLLGTPELPMGCVRFPERFLVGFTCLSCRLSGKGIEKLHMRRDIEKLLVLMLATEIDRAAERLCELLH